jgi:hypothetical protein
MKTHKQREMGSCTYSTNKEHRLTFCFAVVRPNAIYARHNIVNNSYTVLKRLFWEATAKSMISRSW